MLTDASEKLDSLLELLRVNAGLDLTATLDRRRSQQETGRPGLRIVLMGRDTHRLTENSGELLYALEHIAGKILGLEPEERQLSLDAEDFKASHARGIQDLANHAIDTVYSTSLPYTFAPMNARDRHLLHLALAHSGLTAKETGEGPSRTVVLCPAGDRSPVQGPARESHGEIACP